jgi:hypothetical protein
MFIQHIKHASVAGQLERKESVPVVGEMKKQKEMNSNNCNTMLKR